MEIKKMKLSDLQAAAYNPRVKLEKGMEEYEKLKKSLLEFGFVEPPVFNKRTGNLVGGHQRVAVAKELEICEEISVSVIDVPIEKEKALNIALNKITGKWDDEKLANLLASFDSETQILSGFEETEIDQLLSSFEVLPDNQLGDFTNKEIELSGFSENEFECKCPKCGFMFDRE